MGIGSFGVAVAVGTGMTRVWRARGSADKNSTRRI